MLGLRRSGFPIGRLFLNYYGNNRRVKVCEVRELFARAETFSAGAGQPRAYEIPVFGGTAELTRYAGDTLVDDLPTSALSSCEVVTVNVGDAIQLVD